MSAWNGFIDCELPRSASSGTHLTASLLFPTAFFLTAHFSQEDYPYDWYVAILVHSLVRRRSACQVSIHSHDSLRALVIACASGYARNRMLTSCASDRLMHWLSKARTVLPWGKHRGTETRVPV